MTTGGTLTARADRPVQTRRAPPRRQLLIAAGVPALAAAVVFAVAHDGLIDDGLITASAARTLALHGGWGLIPGVPSNSQTSPLNVLLLAAVTFVVRSAIVAVGLVWVAAMAAVGGFAGAVAGRVGGAWWAGPAAGVLVAGSPLVVSTIGLETALAVALMSALAWALVARGAVAVGVVCGLMVLCRPDLAVIAAIGLMLAGRGWWRATAVAVPLGASFYVWSWFVLGTALPDTFFLRVGGGGWSDDRGTGVYETFTFANGPLLYLHYHRAETVLLLVLAALGVAGALLLARRGKQARAVAAVTAGAGLAHWAVMLLVDPGPVAWYYAPVLAGLTVAGVLGAATVPHRRAGAAVVLACCVATLAVTLGRPAPWPRPPVIANYGTAPAYAAVAADLPAGPVVSPGEIGALAFHCDGRCVVLDAYSDGGRAAELIRERRAGSSGPARWLLDLNFTHWAPPAPVPAASRLRFDDAPDPTPRGLQPMRSWPVGTVWHPGIDVALLEPGR